MTSPANNPAEFLARHNPASSHPVTVIDVNPGNDKSPFIVLRYGEYEVIVNPIGLSDHLSVDVHSFVSGERATGAAFGMTNGAPFAFPGTGTTSHGQPSAALVAVLVGKQS